MSENRGPLSGVKVIEIEGIGPGPFCAMALADLGANVLTVGRGGTTDPNAGVPITNRGRAGRLSLDLKSAEDRDRLLSLVEKADVVIEGFRPGVLERLGLGPDVLLGRNPRLILGRMTGWGQSGPWSQMAGHDINYISLSGALHAMGAKDSPPMPPLNLVGDFGGGGMLLALGIACALFETRSSGQGQVIDASMVEGSSMLMSMLWGFRAMGMWGDERGRNLLDGSFYYYRCYECADGRWMAVGAIEPQFRKILFEKTGLADQAEAMLARPDHDAESNALFEAAFKQHDRDYWEAAFEGTDACVSPVLSMSEAPLHPHNQARGTFTQLGKETHPIRAPRFSRTPLLTPGQEPDRSALMAQWGLED